HLGLDLVGDRLEEDLRPARLADADLAGHPQAERDDDEPGDQRAGDRVAVQRDAEDVPLRVLPDLDVDLGEVVGAHVRTNSVHDVGRRLRKTGTAAPISIRIWNTARPTNTPRPSGRMKKPSPSASSVITPSRAMTPRRNCFLPISGVDA